MKTQLRNLSGRFYIIHKDKSGKILGEYKIPNGQTTEGINALLNIMFFSTAKISNWYIGLINSSGYTGVADADTAATHTGWTEFTSYTGDRKAWSTAISTAESITSASGASFAITAGGTLKGVFLQSTSTKSSTSGTLFATSLFASDLAVNNGDTLSIVYTVAA